MFLCLLQVFSVTYLDQAHPVIALVIIGCGQSLLWGHTSTGQVFTSDIRSIPNNNIEEIIID